MHRLKSVSEWNVTVFHCALKTAAQSYTVLQFVDLKYPSNCALTAVNLVTAQMRGLKLFTQHIFLFWSRIHTCVNLCAPLIKKYDCKMNVKTFKEGFTVHTYSKVLKLLFLILSYSLLPYFYSYILLYTNLYFIILYYVILYFIQQLWSSNLIGW